MPALATAPVPAASVVFTPSADTAFGNMSFYDTACLKVSRLSVQENGLVLQPALVL